MDDIDRGCRSLLDGQKWITSTPASRDAPRQGTNSQFGPLNSVPRKFIRAPLIFHYPTAISPFKKPASNKNYHAVHHAIAPLVSAINRHFCCSPLFNTKLLLSPLKTRCTIDIKAITCPSPQRSYIFNRNCNLNIKGKAGFYIKPITSSISLNSIHRAISQITP